MVYFDVVFVVGSVLYGIVVLLYGKNFCVGIWE